MCFVTLVLVKFALLIYLLLIISSILLPQLHHSLNFPNLVKFNLVPLLVSRCSFILLDVRPLYNYENMRLLAKLICLFVCCLPIFAFTGLFGFLKLVSMVVVCCFFVVFVLVCLVTFYYFSFGHIDIGCRSFLYRFVNCFSKLSYFSANIVNKSFVSC